MPAPLSMPLRNARLAARLTQEQVCERVGRRLGRTRALSPQSLSRIERGQRAPRDFAVALALVKVLRVSPEVFLARGKPATGSAR